jgi:hypothetical protein
MNAPRLKHPPRADSLLEGSCAAGVFKPERFGDSGGMGTPPQEDREPGITLKEILNKPIRLNCSVLGHPGRPGGR